LTSDTRVIDVPGVPRFEVAPHHCFACGTTNVHGLGLVLHVEPRSAWTEFTLRRDFQGWDGIAHGGIIATVLDEVMAWSLAGSDDWGFTARMAIEFRRPVPIGVTLRAEGSISQHRRRVIQTSARLVNVEDGQLLASATGSYVAADAERKLELRARYGLRAVDTPANVDAGS
jgi:acyl-coenzyme A thioesterase PaaI-like protein